MSWCPVGQEAASVKVLLGYPRAPRRWGSSGSSDARTSTLLHGEQSVDANTHMKSMTPQAYAGAKVGTENHNPAGLATRLADTVVQVKYVACMTQDFYYKASSAQFFNFPPEESQTSSCCTQYSCNRVAGLSFLQVVVVEPLTPTSCVLPVTDIGRSMKLSLKGPRSARRRACRLVSTNHTNQGNWFDKAEINIITLTTLSKHRRFMY